MLGEIDLLLPHREPMDAAGIFAWMQARALPGVETSTAASFARNLRMPRGPAWFEVRQDGTGRLRLRARVAHLGDLAPLVATARRIFDLDADPLAVDAALSSHPLLAPLVARVPGIRVPGAADPHEMLIRAMVGQQISVAAARTALSALTAALGERIESSAEGRNPTLRSPSPSPLGASRRPEPRGRVGPAQGAGSGLLFPTMTAIAEHGAEALRGPGARIRAITGAAA